MAGNCVALLTDFGIADHFSASMKGVILSIHPNAAIVDITHQVPPHDIETAAFLLFACYADLPPETVFAAVVDPGVGSSRRAIAARSNGRYFVAPDNGLLSMILTDSSEIFEITNPKFTRESISNTFHGRDIFAPAAAHLAAGRPISDIGPRIEDPILLPALTPYPCDDATVEGAIIHIDHFGNLITNLRAEHIPVGGRLAVGKHSISRFASSYDEVPAGEPFAIVGSLGLIEISIDQGSAAQMLHASRGTSVRVLL
ncbi:MAG: SAM-dependent chlorinase/fluorinase [Acidobacteriota bacterium]